MYFLNVNHFFVNVCNAFVNAKSVFLEAIFHDEFQLSDQ